LPRNVNFRVLQDYVDYLNEVFNQTITDSRLVILNQRYITCFQNETFQPLILKPRRYLFFHQLVSVHSGTVVVEDCGYSYSLSPNPDDEEKWIFRYEYSLEPEEHIPHAHVHINASRGEQQLKHYHFPTERISIEKIIAHLILEHGVRPRRADWFEFLSQSHMKFTKLRTDPPLFP
jgi:hypothetical protein